MRIFDSETLFTAAITADVSADVSKDAAGVDLVEGPVVGTDVKYTGADVDYSSPDADDPTKVVSLQHELWNGNATGNTGLGPIQGSGNSASGSLQIDFASPMIAAGFPTLGLRTCVVKLYDSSYLLLEEFTLNISEAEAGYLGILSDEAFSRMVIEAFRETGWMVGDLAGQLAP